ncbi:cation transporter [Actinomyces faecalis]|uniref:cation transporter n=1 Tax=Actinomyces faecalis TaxID=2722820 RepID=UPI0015580DDF|nr:cation transporter [Actinomyces faecalis]
MTDSTDDREVGEEPELTASTLDQRGRRVVALVAGLNLAGLLIEVVVASMIGSASLLADAADFLEDFLINALVLAALGWSVAGRRRASRWLAGLILLPALAALATAVWKVVTGAPPDGGVLSGTAVLAMVLNAASALALMSLRGRGGALVRGAWLAARNDVLANLLMVAAGLVTLARPSVWPDVVVGAFMAVVNLRAAREVLEQARCEDPALELDED